MSTAKRRPAARRGEGEKLRSEIMEVTARLLENTDAAGTLSLRAIAREVGVAATSIYLHFDSLETLVRAVKDERYEQLRAALLAADTDAPNDPRGRLRAAARAYVDFALDRPGTYKLLFSSTLNVPPAAGDQFVGERAFRVAVEVLREVHETDEGAQRAATQLWCLLHGMVILRADRPKFPWPPLESQVDDAVDRMLRA